MKFRWLGLAFAFILVVGGIGYWRWYDWRDHSQDAVILAAARRYGVEPALVKAVVWRESRFNPKAHGKAGEFGLMQVRETAAKEWAQAERLNAFSTAHLLDPGTNTLAGAWYLRKLLKRYERTDNPLHYALADYNAGRSNVLRWNKASAATNSAIFVEAIDFGGTRKYVRAVVRRAEQYRPLFKPKE
ncbi:MAG: lytic transglycosylase domain-containing protein [Verrucomicrobia bacterium]|nr:lytic transglycosylase domain-containing protein [Verrucomicrobiota bacterium]